MEKVHARHKRVSLNAESLFKSVQILTMEYSVPQCGSGQEAHSERNRLAIVPELGHDIVKLLLEPGCHSNPLLIFPTERHPFLRKFVSRNGWSRNRK